MFNSSRFLAFIVALLVISSFLFIFIFHDFFFAAKNPAVESAHDDYNDTDGTFASEIGILLPIIIDGRETTALMSAAHLNFQKAVDFCEENNMALPEKPFEIQSLQYVENGNPRIAPTKFKTFL